MPFQLTLRRAAVLSALAAALAHAPATGNRYALDDSPIIERNPAAQTIGNALRAFDDAWWPPEHNAGLWRPAVILSFAVDYQLSRGSPAWLHAMNVLLHAAVTFVLVLVLGTWLGTAGALAAGLLFALHPVHVEAVANLVGRAELMCALFLLSAVLCARSVRERRDAGLATAPREVLLFALVVLALLSKEHAVVAVPLLLLDELALEPRRRMPLRDYAVLSLATLAWLLVRRVAEGGAGFDAVAPTFFGLSAIGRISTMMPAFFTIVRLMLWPFDLSPDYHPLIIERLEGPTPQAALGFLVLISVAALALFLWRRHRALSVGLIMAGLAWFPTSNLLLPTGIVLSERTLYLPSAGVVLVLAVLWSLMHARLRSAATAVLVLVLAAWTVRTVTRIPVWRNTQTLVVSALLAHPESYKVHQSAARVFVRLGDRTRAQAEYRNAAALFDRDPYMLSEAAANAIEIGRPAEALALLRRSERLDPDQALTQQMLARLMLEGGNVPEALRAARRAVLAAPRSVESARMLAAAFISSGQPDSARAVWPAFRARGGGRFDAWLLRSTTFKALGMADSARLALDSARGAAPADSISRRRLAEATREVTGIP